MRNGPAEITGKTGRFVVSLMKFNKLKGKAPDAVVSIVEGEDDPTFYSKIYSRLGLESPDIYFVANGKDNVLSLRAHMTESKEAPKGGFNTYFVDKDFDGLKGGNPGVDLYVTPTYSLENILVCRNALRKLLVSEFRLGSAACIDDVDRILQKFDGFIEEHSTELLEANSILHWIRARESSGHKASSGSINSSESKFATIVGRDLSVRKEATGSALASLLSLSVDLQTVDLAETRYDFELLNPQKDWRGKFIFFLFRKFISALVEDRNSQEPRHFSEGKGKINLDVTTKGMIRNLASECDIPPCLSAFAKSRESELATWRAAAE